MANPVIMKTTPFDSLVTIHPGMVYVITTTETSKQPESIMGRLAEIADLSPWFAYGNANSETKLLFPNAMRMYVVLHEKKNWCFASVHGALRYVLSILKADENASVNFRVVEVAPEPFDNRIKKGSAQTLYPLKTTAVSNFVLVNGNALIFETIKSLNPDDITLTDGDRTKQSAEVWNHIQSRGGGNLVSIGLGVAKSSDVLGANTKTLATVVFNKTTMPYIPTGTMLNISKNMTTGLFREASTDKYLETATVQLIDQPRRSATAAIDAFEIISNRLSDMHRLRQSIKVKLMTRDTTKSLVASDLHTSTYLNDEAERSKSTSLASALKKFLQNPSVDEPGLKYSSEYGKVASLIVSLKDPLTNLDLSDKAIESAISVIIPADNSQVPISQRYVESSWHYFFKDLLSLDKSGGARVRALIAWLQPANIRYLVARSIGQSNLLRHVVLVGANEMPLNYDPYSIEDRVANHSLLFDRFGDNIAELDKRAKELMQEIATNTRDSYAGDVASIVLAHWIFNYPDPDTDTRQQIQVPVAEQTYTTGAVPLTLDQKFQANQCMTQALRAYATLVKSMYPEHPVVTLNNEVSATAPLLIRQFLKVRDTFDLTDHPVTRPNNTRPATHKLKVQPIVKDPMDVEANNPLPLGTAGGDSDDIPITNAPAYPNVAATTPAAIQVANGLDKTETQLGLKEPMERGLNKSVTQPNNTTSPTNELKGQPVDTDPMDVEDAEPLPLPTEDNDSDLIPIGDAPVYHTGSPPDENPVQWQEPVELDLDILLEQKKRDQEAKEQLKAAKAKALQQTAEEMANEKALESTKPPVAPVPALKRKRPDDDVSGSKNAAERDAAKILMRPTETEPGRIVFTESIELATKRLGRKKLSTYLKQALAAVTPKATVEETTRKLNELHEDEND